MKKINLAVSAAMALALMTGCTDSGDSWNAESGTPKITIIDGVAIDGEINGATVCVNHIENNTCDEGEDNTTTDVSGNFILHTSQEGSLLLVGGKDMGTGLPFTGTLKAPANSTIVSPLTSMIEALMDATTTAEEAETTLKKALGIDPAVALTAYNPFEKADTANTDAEKKNAKAVLAAQAQIQTLVHAASSTVAGADGNTSIADAMDSVTESLAQSLNDAVEIAKLSGDTEVIEISSKMVAKATKDAANEVFEDKPAAKVAAKAVAESSAVHSVAQADLTKTTIAEGDIADATLALNSGMVAANTTLETKAKEAAKEVADKIADDELSDEAILAIATAQQNAEDAANAIIAKEKAALQAAADAKVAADLAASENATQAQIVAAQEAAAVAAQAAADQADAEEAAAVAAQAAATKEADVAEAAEKIKIAEAAEIKAKADKALAVLEKAAADAAAAKATAAKATTEQTAAEAAAAAVTAAADEAKGNIDAAKEAALVAATAVKEVAATSAEAAAEEAEAAAEEAEAAAKLAAEAAQTAEEKEAARIAAEAEAARIAAALAECTAKGGVMKDNECMNIPTGGTGASTNW